MYDHHGNEIVGKKCPFCRTPIATSDEEFVERLQKRAEVNDANAMCNLGVCYRDGMYGIPLDHAKALELFVSR